MDNPKFIKNTLERFEKEFCYRNKMGLRMVSDRWTANELTKFLIEELGKAHEVGYKHRVKKRKKMKRIDTVNLPTALPLDEPLTTGTIFYTHTNLMDWSSLPPKSKHACLLMGHWCLKNAIERPLMAWQYFLWKTKIKKFNA